MRKTAFQFLLKIIDSFPDMTAIGHEYYALFTTAIDHPVMRENAQRPYSIMELDFDVKDKDEYMVNEYKEQYEDLNDINKTIAENSVHTPRSEEVTRVY